MLIALLLVIALQAFGVFNLANDSGRLAADQVIVGPILLLS